MTYIIAVANEKGGVAKTTTAISLGGALVKLGQDVLLVDVDPQANLTLALGFPPHKIRRSIADVMLNSAAPLSVSKETSTPGLDMLPSSSEMGMAERFSDKLCNQFNFMTPSYWIVHHQWAQSHSMPSSPQIYWSFPLKRNTSLLMHSGM